MPQHAVRTVITGLKDNLTALIAQEQLMRGNELFAVWSDYLVRFDLPVSISLQSMVIPPERQCLDFSTSNIFISTDSPMFRHWERFVSLAEEKYDLDVETIMVSKNPLDDVYIHRSKGAGNSLFTGCPRIHCHIDPNNYPNVPLSAF